MKTIAEHPFALEHKGKILKVYNWTPASLAFDTECVTHLKALVWNGEKVSELSIAYKGEFTSAVDFNEASELVKADFDHASYGEAVNKYLIATVEEHFKGITPHGLLSSALYKKVGKYPKGLKFEVFKGKKYAKGLVGTVTAYGEGAYGKWFKMVFENGTEGFINPNNLEVIEDFSEAALAEAESIIAKAKEAAMTESLVNLTPLVNSHGYHTHINYSTPVSGFNWLTLLEKMVDKAYHAKLVG